MTPIIDSIKNIPFLENAFAYLKEKYDINAYITDKISDTVENTDDTGSTAEHKIRRFYPIVSPENEMGIFCISRTNNTIDMAEAEINLLVGSINEIVQREIEINQMSNEIIELSEQINFLFNFATQTTGINKIHAFCIAAIETVSKKISADQGFLIVRSHDDDIITIPNNITEDKAIDIISNDIFKIALQKGEPVISKTSDSSSLLACPIIVKDGSIGTMAFLRNPDKQQFTAYEKKFIGVINKSISSTLEILRLYEGLKKLYLNTVKALAAAIDAKDPYTHGHSFRVAKYSVAMARKLNLSEEAISDLEIAAYMHDLGKIGISEAVLKKAGKLTDEEYNEIKKHPHFTGKILAPINLPDFIVLTAIQHHERLDGKGYPLGLSGDQIISTAKIVAVADVFDALTSDRPYRPAMPVEKALEILINDIDRAFDRKIVLALIDVLKDNDIIEEIKDVYRDLKFVDIHGLNCFLTTLTDQLIRPVIRI
ncbi:HD-GYP domain-containing protein [hot springs metagenome]|uniref:HD-GYP domain-containing protein n=1 Tax=hot springs metagenome TaxID=433727 RepID=A0A5J4L519_9ZZZZ